MRASREVHKTSPHYLFLSGGIRGSREFAADTVVSAGAGYGGACGGGKVDEAYGHDG